MNGLFTDEERTQRYIAKLEEDNAEMKALLMSHEAHIEKMTKNAVVMRGEKAAAVIEAARNFVNHTAVTYAPGRTTARLDLISALEKMDAK